MKEEGIKIPVPVCLISPSVMLIKAVKKGTSEQGIATSLHQTHTFKGKYKAKDTQTSFFLNTSYSPLVASKSAEKGSIFVPSTQVYPKKERRKRNFSTVLRVSTNSYKSYTKSRETFLFRPPDNEQVSDGTKSRDESCYVSNNTKYRPLSWTQTFKNLQRTPSKLHIVYQSKEQLRKRYKEWENKRKIRLKPAPCMTKFSTTCDVPKKNRTFLTGTNVDLSPTNKGKMYVGTEYAVPDISTSMASFSAKVRGKVYDFIEQYSAQYRKCTSLACNMKLAYNALTGHYNAFTYGISSQNTRNRRTMSAFDMLQFFDLVPIRKRFLQGALSE